ncbi:MAG TPA: CBS domain-containing protein [Povalibacter sp.]|nr:CBS domain-containing protein [Povalibacter sp.]
MFVDSILPNARERLALIAQDAPLMEAARFLSSASINLVVVHKADGTLAGVISKTDVVRQIGHCAGNSCVTAASAVMTREVVACHPGESLTEVWATMKKRGLKHIPVIDEQSHPIGVLYARDALQVLLVEVEYEELLLRDYVMGIGYQ